MARTIDSDRKHLTSVLSAAAAHRGTSLVEIYQNCPIFNDGAFDAIKSPDTKADAIIPLVHGEPIRFGSPTGGGTGPGPRPGHRRRQGRRGRPTSARSADDLLVHDAHSPDPTTAFAISRLTDAGRSTRRRSASSARSSARRTTTRRATRSRSAAQASPATPTERLAAPDRRRRHLDRGVVSRRAAERAKSATV